VSGEKEGGCGRAHNRKVLVWDKGAGVEKFGALPLYFIHMISVSAQNNKILCNLVDDF